MKLIEEKNKDTYCYETNDGQEIKITFVDGKFEYCNYMFPAPYDRETWKALSDIEKEIKRLEKTYN